MEDVTCQQEKAIVRTIIPMDDMANDVSLCSPVRGGWVGQYQGWGSPPNRQRTLETGH